MNVRNRRLERVNHDMNKYIKLFLHVISMNKLVLMNRVASHKIKGAGVPDAAAVKVISVAKCHLATP